MDKIICEICGFKLEGVLEELPSDWRCPVCSASKDFLKKKIYKEREETVFLDIDQNNVSIERNQHKCVKCGNCKSVCQYKQGVYGHYDINKIKCKTICVDCGQCSIACPTGAIDVKNQYKELSELIKKKNKVIICQTAPSVRVSLAEMFGEKEGTICTGKLVACLRKLGFNYVFDTTFGADLTVMEEAHELIERLKSKAKLPMFTSCCPSWVKFLEIFYPKHIPNLSTCKSPILMQGSIIKSYWANLFGIKKKDIVSVAITPCTAKKSEIFNNDDVDYVITVRELAKWILEENIDYKSLAESEFDSLMTTGSGAGIIFGVSGGVMESVIRTAYFLVNNENLKNIEFENIRENDGLLECNVDLKKYSIKIAIVSGLINARKIFDKIEKGGKYDFIEVMSCLGGCMAGGGQPKNLRHTYEEVRNMRKKSLYDLDRGSNVRFCHENSDIVNIYKNYLNKVGSKQLHTTYKDQSEILGQN